MKCLFFSLSFCYYVATPSCPKNVFHLLKKHNLLLNFEIIFLITFLYHHHHHHHLTIITYKSKSMSMVTQDEPTSPPPPAAPSSQLTGRGRGYRRRAASDAFALATGARPKPLRSPCWFVSVPICVDFD